MTEFKLCLKIFWSFLKVSTFTFGGGYAIISLVKSKVVEKNKWITDEELTDIITMAQVMPGLYYISVASFIGHRICGVIGALAASIGVLVPSAISVMSLALLFQEYYENQIVENILLGIICGVTALTFSILIDFLRKIISSKLSILIFIVSLFLLEILKLKPFTIIATSILIGTVYSFIFINKGGRTNV